MLASITPLGERSRGFSWGVTVSAFAVGAVGAGALAGAAAGALGSLAPDGTWRDVTALAVIALALALELTPLRRHLPSTRRQVNEDWLTRYRGWVYGVAFGAQLGAGVVTIVSSAAVYAAAVGAVLCGTVASGAAVGVAFGAVRALALLPARAATDPPGLLRLHERVALAETPTRRAGLAVLAAAIVLVAVGLL
jgi:MFS family permease